MGVKDDPDATLSKSEPIRKTEELVENVDPTEPIVDSPPDGGWGWVVVVGAAYIQMQVITIGTTFGVYFAHLTSSSDASPCNSSMSSYNSSSTWSWNHSSSWNSSFSPCATPTSGGIPAWLVSLIPSIMSLIMFTLSPMSTAMSKHYSHRGVAVSGATFLALSTFLSVAVDNFYWFFIIFSVFSGIGSGFLLVQGNVCVKKYFKKRRGTANGIFMAGGALGKMVMPPVMRYILDAVGFRGAILVHACFLSLTIPAAAAFRPLETPKLRDEKDGAKETPAQIGLFVKGIWLPRVGDIFSWKVIRNPLFLLLTFTVVTSRAASRGLNLLLPAYGSSIGLDEETSTFLLTIMAISDLASRLLSPQIGDRFPNLPKKWIFMTFQLLMIISTVMFGTIVDDLKTAIAACLIFGVGIGGVTTYNNLLFVEGLGIDKVQDTISLMYLATGFASFSVLPLFGAARDLTGDFRMSFLLISLCVGLGVAVWGLEHKLDKYKFKENKVDGADAIGNQIDINEVVEVQQNCKDNKAYMPDGKTS